MYAWNSISKRGPFRRSSLPRAIAKELKLKQDSSDSGSTSQHHSFPMTSTSSNGNNQAPKGCYCQMGSIVRAIFSLAFILGVSGGLIYWVYITQFSEEIDNNIIHLQEELLENNNIVNNNIKLSEHDYSILQTNELLETFRRSKAMLDMEINFSQEQKDISEADHTTSSINETDENDGGEERNHETPTTNLNFNDNGEQLYIDFQGNLHRLSELQSAEKLHFEEKPVYVVEAVTTSTTTTTTTTTSTTTTTTTSTTTTTTITTTTQTTTTKAQGPVHWPAQGPFQGPAQGPAQYPPHWPTRTTTQTTTTTTEITTINDVDIVTTQQQDIQLPYIFAASLEEITETTTTNSILEEDSISDNNNDQTISDLFFGGFMPTPMVKNSDILGQQGRAIPKIMVPIMLSTT